MEVNFGVERLLDVFGSDTLAVVHIVQMAAAQVSSILDVAVQSIAKI